MSVPLGYEGKIYTFGGFSAQNNSAVADANVYDPFEECVDADRAAAARTRLGVGDRSRRRDSPRRRPRRTQRRGRIRYTTLRQQLLDSLAAAGRARPHGARALTTEDIYAIGGRIDTPAHNTSYVDVYDPKSDNWTSAAPLPAPRSGMAVADYEGGILAMGGEQAGMTSAFKSNFAYDPTSDGWSPSMTSTLPEGRHGTGAVVVDATRCSFRPARPFPAAADRATRCTSFRTSGNWAVTVY